MDGESASGITGVGRQAGGRMLFIVNPASHGGAGAVAWEQFQGLWHDPIPPVDVVRTRQAGEGRELASTTERDTVVVVGGDGTVNEVMSGVLDKPGERPRLAIVPAGTGNDDARHARIGSVVDAVAALRDGMDRAFDVIEVDWTDHRGEHRGYAFLQAIVGFSGSVAVRPSVKRVFGATVAYYLGALTAMAAYQAPLMAISTDGHRYDAPIWMVIIGNAEWTSGASMRLSPGARTDDAQLNVTVIPKERSKLRMAARMMPKIASGEHVHDPDVDYFTATRLDLHSSRPTTLDLDGELREASRVHCRVLPGALQMVTGPTPSDR